MLATAIAAVAAGPVQAYKSPAHIFSVKDIQRGFDGSTIGPDGARTLRGTICDAPISPIACPEGVEPLIDKDGATLWPIDSAFGFNVVDFLGAQVKTYNGDYQEGYAGDIRRENVTVGLRVSNAATDTYKVKAGWGTWCQGLGGTSVKCSTEHYSVMEHVLSCHETIPYMEADPVTGAQAVKQFPDGSASFNCATAMLDDVLNIIEGGVDTGVRLTDATPGAQLDPNDNTTVLDDIAVSNDYSATLKDDGKVLYRWGSLIKRPKDVRMYAKIPLPAEWKVPGADYPVTSAKLVIKHVVTNNPNDQVRPEDLENEAAIGRLPSYKVETIGEDEVWKSLKSCYEGDGDLIDTEEGANDPTFIGVGTVFKNEPFIVDGTDPEAPLPFSADLTEAFTNAWYTTVDREPFEWSYDADPNPLVQDFVSSPVPNPALGELWSGPRWRLKPNKFGQDIPGLEIPLIECSSPPYAHDNIKYEVGASVTTVLNLLDWDEAEGPSPLASSKGWVDVTQNPFVEIHRVINGIPVTTNGLPMTEDFDLAVYIKGDKKPTSIYSAQLFINEEPTAADMEPYVDPLSGGGGSTP